MFSFLSRRGGSARSQLKPEEISRRMGEALERIGNDDYPGALAIWRDLADKGHGPAATCLAACCINGHGCAASPAEAVRWLRRAAELGDPVGQRNLGHALFQGLDGSRDEAESFHWFRQAADNGEPYAQNMVGWMLETGTGTPVDFEAARSYVGKAASHGLASALTRYGQLCVEGRGGPVDGPAAIGAWNKAAEQADPDATALLGLAHIRGEFVQRDLFRAVVFLLVARRHGSTLGNAALAESLAILDDRRQSEAVRLADEIGRNPPWEEPAAAPVVSGAP